MKNKFLMTLVVLVSTLLVSQVRASECSSLYFNNTPVVIEGSTEICNDFYVSLFNKDKRAVILTSEVLKPNPTKVKRLSTFRFDSRVGKASANNSDYTASGYDRGHMTPAGDASTNSEMYSTFFFTNMTPQVPELNRGEWAHLEEHVRVSITDTTHVLTIATYPKNSKMIGSGIPIPTGYWKIIYYKDHTSYFYAPNTKEAKVQPMPPTDIYVILQESP